MRRIKANVSHRMRRQPGLPGARWSRALLGLGAVTVLGLAIGPSVGRWMSSGGSAGRPASATSPRPVAVTRAALEGSGLAPSPSPDTAPDPKSLPTAAPPAAAATQGGAYWIQMGVFLDPGNADRLATRLRADGLTVGTTVLEQSRVAYRVLLGGPDGATEAPPAVIDQVRKLGLGVEETADGTAVTGAVPLRSAVETSRDLLERGIGVRLKQQAGSAAYRVVRVGAYATHGEAERALATLQARGFEGVVVRERGGE